MAHEAFPATAADAARPAAGGRTRPSFARLARWLLRDAEGAAAIERAVRVPFNRAAIAGDELQHVRDVVALGRLAGDGPYTERCEQLLAREIGAERVLLTGSGTAALEMSALLLELRPGDEVVVPSFTFPTTAGAYALFGGRPVFADVRRDTLNVDEARVEERLTPRTRAIVAVHYGGVACDLERLGEIARRHGIALIEDNAHGLFGRWRGQPLGSFGELATLSFHETKNVSCGEGGALVVNDARLKDRAEVLREKGTDRARFLRGETERYSWIDLGSSYVPSEISAAFLLGQLEVADQIQTRRRHVWRAYRDALADWAADIGASLPSIPGDCESAYHVFHVLMPTAADREALLRHLDARRIEATRHYEPLHLSPFAKRLGPQAPCPVAEDVAARIVRLPLFAALSATAQERVIDAVRSYPS
ncbi:MAG TPA: dTDP-4-amino-4,6-dideoxygalactose transaminase [Candidatus Binatia bacterium]|nr:dTDP-4-amino-4,6-dideoxygalactose transaminase [Candidatus Binatia bacterium]